MRVMIIHGVGNIPDDTNNIFTAYVLDSFGSIYINSAVDKDDFTCIHSSILQSIATMKCPTTPSYAALDKPFKKIVNDIPFLLFLRLWLICNINLRRFRFKFSLFWFGDDRSRSYPGSSGSR